jgi:glycosyltransferase involved in cell wall biosynthesis
MNKKTLAVVVPVYNEMESLELFWKRLTSVLNALDTPHEVILVNDGSTDDSLSIIRGFHGNDVKVINLLVNSGHMAALDAGYREADAKWIVSMDSDLQHPPEVIPKLLQIAESSNVDVVYAVRSSRGEDSFVKRFTAKMYYRTLKGFSGIPIHENAADFRLISDRVLILIKQLPPRSHVFRLLIPKLGFSYATCEFIAAERIAGESKYGFRQMVGLALRSVVTFSTRPLMISVYLGALFSLLSIFGLTYSVVQFFSGDTVPGWASVSSGLFLLFGILFFLLGITGTYLAEIWRRTSGIPDYFVDVNSCKSENFTKNGES